MFHSDIAPTNTTAAAATTCAVRAVSPGATSIGRASTSRPTHTSAPSGNTSHGAVDAGDRRARARRHRTPRPPTRCRTRAARSHSRLELGRRSRGPDGASARSAPAARVLGQTLGHGRRLSAPDRERRTTTYAPRRSRRDDLSRGTGLGGTVATLASMVPDTPTPEQQNAEPRRLDHPAGLQRSRAPRGRGRPGPGRDGRVAVQLRDHRRRRRLDRQFGRGRVAASTGSGSSSSSRTADRARRARPAPRPRGAGSPSGPTST